MITSQGMWDALFEDQAARAPCGFYRVRTERRGAWRPARIEKTVAVDPDTGEQLDRSPVKTATIAGEPADIGQVATFGEAITESEYLYLMAMEEINAE